MLRLKIKFTLPLLVTLCISVTGTTATSGVGVAWDVSPADRSDYYPVNHLSWPRFDDSPFVTRTISGTGPRLSPGKKYALAAADHDDDGTANLGLRRVRRDANPETTMEKITGSKNIREARMSAPETWSKQPLSVQFRNRPSLDQLVPDNYENIGGSDEAANLPPPIRAHYAPKADFVTSGRGRSIADERVPVQGRVALEGRGLPPSEGRESRDMPIARSYDEYDVPIFRNIVREHDFDVQIPRNYYYPNRFRSQRDYYYRGEGSRGGSVSPYSYDRYRDEDEDYELYNRYRPTPKPKRIIYYATLPEIVRKPVDLRNYQRPYDPLVRGPEAQQIEPDRNRVAPATAEPSRRPLRYPYDNYDNYVKRSSYYDRRRPTYAADEDRPRDQDRASFKEKMRSDDRKYESQLARLGNDRRLPWPVQIGTEVNVKENERIPGRKIFGQIEGQGYDRYEGSRIKKTSGTADRKEDTNVDNNNNSSSSDNSSN